jgi:cytochrome c biogenesis protein CcdA
MWGAILTWVAARGDALTGELLLFIYSLGFAVLATGADDSFVE